MGKNNELMNNLIHKFAVPLSAVLFVAFFMTTAFILMTKVSWADNGQAPTSGRLITIHDRGVEKVIVSQAATISDALDEAGIAVDAKDSVEPALDEKLVASDYQVNIYRARPVIVIDGATQTKVMTPYQTATQIAESAGVKLYSEDKTSLRQSDNIIAEGAGLQLIVDRATPFTFDLFGEVKTVRTQAETVDGMLTEKGIKLGVDDRLSIDKNSKITDGMSIRLWREGKQTVSAEVAIDFPVEKIQDGDRAIGYSEVRTAGEKGLRTVTYEVLIQNGQEVSRTEIASLTTKEPKKEVVVVGIKNNGSGLTKSMGVKFFTDSKGVVHRETYYDLPMSVVMGNCNQGGKYTVRPDGVKVDSDGYIIIAAALSRYPRCSVVETSLGPGKVYDTGGFTTVHPDGFDLATDWSNYNGN